MPTREEKLPRMSKSETVPIDRVRGLLAIGILPMALCIHCFRVDRLSLARNAPTNCAAMNSGASAARMRYRRES
jgi:hypothetical protein